MAGARLDAKGGPCRRAGCSYRGQFVELSFTFVSGSPNDASIGAWTVVDEDRSGQNVVVRAGDDPQAGGTACAHVRLASSSSQVDLVFASQLLLQGLNFATVISTALMLWKGATSPYTGWTRKLIGAHRPLARPQHRIPDRRRPLRIDGAGVLPRRPPLPLPVPLRTAQSRRHHRLQRPGRGHSDRPPSDRNASAKGTREDFGYGKGQGQGR